MRFLVDMPVTPDAVEHLRRLGHEATHAAVAGLATVSDREILAAARREARVVVTADLDYPRLLALENAEGRRSFCFVVAAIRTGRCCPFWIECWKRSRRRAGAFGHGRRQAPDSAPASASLMLDVPRPWRCRPLYSSTSIT